MFIPIFVMFASSIKCAAVFLCNVRMWVCVFGMRLQLKYGIICCIANKTPKSKIQKSPARCVRVQCVHAYIWCFTFGKYDVLHFFFQLKKFYLFQSIDVLTIHTIKHTHKWENLSSVLNFTLCFQQNWQKYSNAIEFAEDIRNVTKHSCTAHQ